MEEHIPSLFLSLSRFLGPRYLSGLVVTEEESDVPSQEVFILHVRDALQAHNHSRIPELPVYVYCHLDIEHLHGLREEQKERASERQRERGRESEREEGDGGGGRGNEGKRV